jgi:hypothetical protein
MLRGADSRVGRGVKQKPHLLNDLAKAKGKALISAYETDPTPVSNFKFPTKKVLHAADLATTSGLGQMIVDRLHGKKLSADQKVALGTLAGGGAGGEFFHPGIGPRKVGGIYQSGYSGEAYKVLDIKPHGDKGFAIKVVALPNKNNPSLKMHEVNPRWHSTWWDHKKDKILMDPDHMNPLPPKARLGRNPYALPGAPLKTQKNPPVYAPRSVGDSADPMVRALNRLSASSPNNVAKLLIEAGSPIRRLLDARLGAKPIHSTGSLMDTHGGFPRRAYTESHVLKGNQSHLPFIPGDPTYGSARFVGLTPERRAALNRVLFQHLYQTRN